jgi:Cu/Ag efflux pump CusA
VKPDKRNMMVLILVIGGLGGSTVITLGLIPAIYALFHKHGEMGLGENRID